MDIPPVDSPSVIEDYELALKTALLEKEYESSLRYTAQVLDTEKSRAKQVEQLLLQYENEALRYRLGQADREFSNVINAEYQVRAQLHDAYNELEELRKSSRVFSKEIEDLRNELTSLNNRKFDCADLTAEVGRLSKELSDSYLELDRVRSQKSATGVSISEKKALERQLNTLEVQMEDEKRAHERSLAKVSCQAEEMNTLLSALEQTRRDLAKEVDARNRHDRIAKERFAEWETQRTALERKLETLNKKPPSAGDQSQVGRIKQTHLSENNQAQGSSNTATQSRPSTHQSTSRLNSDLTIATPGAVRAQNRKMKAPTMPGDKSSFSITPFLNRTKGIQNSPLSSDNETDELNSIDPGELARPADTKNAPSQVQGYHAQPNSDEMPMSKIPSDENQRQLGKPPSGLSYAQEAQYKQLDISHTDDRSEGTSISKHVVQGPAKARKRKLGTQRDPSIFDEEDEEDGSKGMRKPGRKLVSSGRNPGLQSSGLNGALSRVRGFGAIPEFSPLKRDKKRF